MPSRRFAHFRVEVSRARDLVGLGQSLGSMTHGRVDGSDLYRAAIVQIVSALDAYTHGVVLDRAVDILLGRLPNVGSSTKIGLHFSAVQQIIGAPTPVDMELLARTFVAERLSLETFQRPDDIAKAFAMVGIGKLWSSAFPAGSSVATTELSLIVRRRNAIVHQCDADPLTPGQVTPLSDADVLDNILTVEIVVAAIELCI